MAGNEWINGYLEAILDSGSSSISELDDSHDLHQPSAAFNFNLTRYFVEEVVIGVSETDLHRTWIKVVATRNTRERSSRLENMCWRIWHLARKSRHLELEESGRVNRRRLEREEGRRDATEELAEEEDLGFSLEEGGSSSGPSGGGQDQVKRYQRQVSGVQVWSDENKEKKLYIVLISLHGLVRGENMELGRDSDTGGQVKYVVELSRALAMMPGVYRVDLLTRQVSSPDVDWSYSEPTEMLSPGSYEEEDGDNDDIGESSGAYIIRIPCGPRNKYLSKELLWPYLQEFVDGALSHILNMSKALGDQIGKEHRPVWPYVIHGHYADAGDVATLLSGALNVPMVFTGHSLGRNKLEQLLKQGRQSEDINATYKILRRIQAEEMALDASELVITSTQQEIDEQWGLYDGFDVKLEKILRARHRRGLNCHGHYMPRLVVIPPGMDFSSVDVQEEKLANDGAAPLLKIPSIWTDVMRFLTNPHKPMILALSRPDPKKNITTLLKAFGECRALRELANLTLIMGNRDDIGDMSSANSNVLMTVLRLIDKYDLYGTVAYPKHHKQSDVPDIYRLAAKTKGVFINPAFVEPFGLTLIEAAAHGLPIVATKNGGPIDINNALNNGLLVDPHDQNAIADALLKLVADKNLWHECQRNGWRNIHLFSWPEHCRTYLTRVAACRMRHPHWQMDTPRDEISIEESLGESLQDVQDSSLQLSFDAERNSLNSSADQHEFEKVAAVDAKCVLELQEQVKDLLKQIKKYPTKKVEKKEREERNVYNYPLLGRRRRLFVIAVDSYDENGCPDKTMVRVIQKVLKGVRSDSQLARISGFALSTAMPVLETLEVLTSGKIQITDFDALICSSGSEVYYPGTYNTSSDERFKVDPDYMTHIEYRWGYHGVRNAVLKLMNTSNSTSPHDIIQEDVKSSNAHCISFVVKENPEKLKSVDDLRQKVRMRGLRCHLMYCRNFSRLHAVPLLASRSQSLRYLFVRWGLNVSNMYVILGDKGDTDHEEMVAGCHKTIILNGVVQQKASSSERNWSESCQKEDMVPLEHENPFTVRIGSGGVPNSEQILNALQQVTKSASLM